MMKMTRPKHGYGLGNQSEYFTFSSTELGEDATDNKNLAILVVGLLVKFLKQITLLYETTKHIFFSK